MQIKYTWEEFVALAKRGIHEENKLTEDMNYDYPQLTIVRRDGEGDIAEMPDYVIINKFK